MEQFINEMRAITGRTEEVVLGELTKLNSRIDRMGSFMVETNKEVIARIERLEQHIVQPSQKCEAPKSVNTVQYNHAAQSVEAIGTCVYKGQVVNFFGVCAKCGDPILSPSVIGYCTVNKLDTICYPCQKGKTRNAKYTDITFFDGSKGTSAPSPATTDTGIIVNCDICGKPRKYKSAADYLAKKNNAESLGLPGTMCTACAKDALTKINAHEQDQEPEHYMDPVAYEKQEQAERMRHNKNQASVYDFIYRIWKEVFDPAEIKAMKIKDVRDFAEAFNMELGFDGKEWNRNKLEVFEEVASEFHNSVVKTLDLEVPLASVVTADSDGVVNLGF